MVWILTALLRFVAGWRASGPQKISDPAQVFSRPGELAAISGGMKTRKPAPDKQARPALPRAEKPAHKTSQADAAHIAIAGYRRDQQAAIDRIAKLKAARLAREATADQPKPKKPKAPPTTTPPAKTPTARDRTRPSRSRRWGG
jgi:hypothetical protein